ncbi:MAG: DUF4065 domain-containing protein [Rhodospirillaceae bacterium]|nr:DUF4065 domain-containing protein [Rhodospirillaceae bacterium]
MPDDRRAMQPTAVESGFEVVIWFLDRAIADGEYLQPQKLQRLLYLAQAYYGVAKHGQKLMPATFIAADDGPLEPTLFRAFERGRPAVDVRPIEADVQHVLDSIWRQFGAHSTDRLTKLVQRHPPYVEAYDAAPLSEIPFENMIKFYGTQGLKRRQNKGNIDVTPVDKVLRPKVLRNHDGKPVNVRRWAPRRVD